MKIHRRPWRAACWLLLCQLPLMAASGEACFSVLAGGKATAGGAVLFAHNEDDGGPQVVNWIKVPSLTHRAGEVLSLRKGGSFPQASRTAAYLWLQMPGQEFADGYMNEYGVTISSNQCLSRVEEADLTEGGIGYELRRIMAERARSAREAVTIGGALVERFGYHSSGRTYCIADPKEAWVMAVVRGRLWVARRVPDDEVAVVANRYTIGKVNLSDTANFLGSPGLVETARKRGWYDPERDGDFSFRDAYGSPAARYSVRNIARQWRGVSILGGRRDLDPREPLPFSFRPKAKVSLGDLMALLRDHFEGSQFETPGTFRHGNPHGNYVKRICSGTTQYGFVAELRPTMPAAVGAVLWLAPRRPCIQPFVPVYSGINSFPKGFARLPFDAAIAAHFTPDPARYRPTPGLAYWSFAGRAAEVDGDYRRLNPALSQQRDALEAEVLTARKAFETKALTLYREKPAEAREACTRFTAGWLERLWAFNRRSRKARSPSH